MVLTVHSLTTILVLFSLFLSTLAADLPAYPLVRTVLSAGVFRQRLTVNTRCGTHICRVSAVLEMLYRIQD